MSFDFSDTRFFFVRRVSVQSLRCADGGDGAKARSAGVEGLAGTEGAGVEGVAGAEGARGVDTADALHRQMVFGLPSIACWGQLRAFPSHADEALPSPAVHDRVRGAACDRRGMAHRMPWSAP